jgi:transcriptional regulator with XRE-family HTH domain
VSEKVKQVAVRIRSLREISGMSPEALAKKLKVTKAQYNSYESGKTDIPLSALYELANEFKVELTTLLTGEEPRLSAYSLVRKGKGPAASRRKEYDYQDLAYNFKRKKAEIFHITVEPSKKEHKPNSHPGQEFTYVLEGRLKVSIDGGEVVMNEGDALYFDSRHPHAMTALDNRKARFLAFII